jgi:hypothetical protein
MNIKIKTLTIDEKSLTRAMFNQLRRWYPKNLVTRDNKFILGQVDCRDDNVIHLLWTDQNAVYVADIDRYVNEKLNDDFIMFKDWPQIFLRS